MKPYALLVAIALCGCNDSKVSAPPSDDLTPEQSFADGYARGVAAGAGICDGTWGDNQKLAAVCAFGSVTLQAMYDRPYMSGARMDTVIVTRGMSVVVTFRLQRLPRE